MRNEPDKITSMLRGLRLPSGLVRPLCACALLLALIAPPQVVDGFAALAADAKPLEEILKGLPRVYDGRVLDTRLKGDRYEIRVLVKTGTVVELVVDANSGKIIKADPDLQSGG